MHKDPSTSFGEKAVCYTRFRPDYAEAIFDFLDVNMSGGRKLAVELGAGSGQATRSIARMFERVIAIEPDQRLIEQAKLPNNVETRVGAAEEVEFGPQSVDAIISATAFHWMDQPAICKKAAHWLAPGGVFFPFAYNVFKFEGRAQDYFEREFEKWRPYRDARLDNNYDYPAILDRSGVFLSIAPLRTETSIELSAHAAAGLICTASYAAAYAHTVSGADIYFNEVRNTLSAFGERIKVTFPIIGAIGRVC